MTGKMEILFEKLNDLERELEIEIERKEKEFLYKIIRKKVHFERDIKKQHKQLEKKIRHYLRDASILNILTAPFIWFCLIPAVFMDLVITIFQSVCFPVYGIPKVERKDYIVIDRHYLNYLNAIEKLNCAYCGYFNGVMGYVQEVAARTEQYWCPIKHARKIKTIHGRYKNFFDYGNAELYREKIEKIRRSFDDINSDTSKGKAVSPSNPN